MNTIITPNIAYFKEGEVYVYTLPEKPQFSALELLSPAVDTDSQIKQYNDAVSYARAHPFKVHEKDVERIKIKILEQEKIMFSNCNWWNFPDNEEFHLSLNMKIELGECQKACSLYKSPDFCIECENSYRKQVACLIEDDGVKEELPYLAQWIHNNKWTWNFGNSKWCKFSDNDNQISRTTEELANEWYKIQQKSK